MSRRMLTLFSVTGILLLIGSVSYVRSDEASADDLTKTTRMGDTPLTYSVAADARHTGVYYKYDKSSAEAVRRMANDMTMEARKHAATGKPFEGEIVFTHPIPLDDYIAFVRDSGVRVSSTILEGKRGGGAWVQYGAPPAKDGTALDKERLAGFARSGDEIVGAVTALGVIFTPESFERVVNDPRVFAVGSLRRFLSDRVGVHYPGINTDQMFVQPSLLYHAMKKTGIAEPYP